MRLFSRCRGRNGHLRLHPELLLDAIDASRQLGQKMPDCLEVTLGLVHGWTENYPRNASALHVVFALSSY